MKIKATKVINKFKCLQDTCPDTCCKGWSMQLDDQTYAKYTGSSLEDAVDYDGREREIRVMKRDPQTDYCVKFENGICAIHRDKGSDYLGDACHFYPRVTRRFENDTVMTATLSCPEIVNLSIFGEPAELEETEIERLPNTLKNYEGTLEVHQAFIDLSRSDEPASAIMARVYSAAKSLSTIDVKEWPTAAPFFIRISGNMLPEPEYTDNGERFLLQIFAGVFHATGKKMNLRLNEVVEKMEAYLGVKLDWSNLHMALVEEHPEHTEPLDYEDILKKYLAAQISFNSFPYAGIGEDALERVLVLTYKFALIKMALNACNSDSREEIIKTIQSISRIIDHVGDAELILSLMKSFGWDSDAKLMGLITQWH